MSLNNQAILDFSLSANLIFILLFSLLILKKWKRKSWKSLLKKSPRQNTYLTSHYQLKTNLFDKLPKSAYEIIFLGDSLTEQGEWVELLGNPHLKNRGISGDTTKGILKRLDKIVESHPLKIFLMIGINDFLNEEKKATHIASNYQKILENIKFNTPESQVFVQSLLPINNARFAVKIDNDNIVELNCKIQELSKLFSCQYVDLYKEFVNGHKQLDTQYTLDGVHLSGQGYLLWKKVIEKYIDKEVTSI